MIVDNEEFYEQEKPLSLKDVRCLIVILRQVTSFCKTVVQQTIFLCEAIFNFDSEKYLVITGLSLD